MRQPRRAVVIAHGDLDGMTAAAIIVAALKAAGRATAWTLRFTQPFTLQETLRRLPEGADMLVIVDVALDEEHAGHILSILEEMEGPAEKLWVDHHSSTIRHALDLLDRRFSLLLSVDGCAATIAGKAFLHLTGDEQFYSKLVLIGEAGDKVRELSGNHPLRQALETLGNAIAANPTDDAFKERLVRMWVEEKILVDDEAARRAEEAEEKLRALLKESSENVRYESSHVKVIDLRDTRVHGYAGKIASHHAKTYGKVVLLLFRVGTNNTIVTARVPPSIDLDVASLIRELAPLYGGGGGGHPKAASARVPAMHADDFVRELVKRIEASLQKPS